MKGRQADGQTDKPKEDISRQRLHMVRRKTG
jgi:hypothetical protein